MKGGRTVFSSAGRRAGPPRTAARGTARPPHLVRRDRCGDTLPRVLAGHRARASLRLAKEDIKNCKRESFLHHAREARAETTMRFICIHSGKAKILKVGRQP